MNRIIKYFAQIYANFIIRQLERTVSSETELEFMFWMEQGIKLDNYCVSKGIYLD
jgi:hypothetical protein